MTIELDNLRIFQVFHKDSDTLVDANWIEPLRVGGYRNFTMGATDVLDNINHLNDYYNELTAIYWVWKNLRYEYVGFFHYRRVLAFKLDKTWSGEFGYTVKNSPEIRSYYGSDKQRSRLIELLEVAPVVIPRLTASRLSTAGHYIESHDSESWEVFIEALYSKYGQSGNLCKIFEFSNLQTSFNMFVMRNDLFHRYCEELFCIIDGVFNRIGPRKHSYNRRYPGFLAERFLHFWLIKERIAYSEVPVILFEE